MPAPLVIQLVSSDQATRLRWASVLAGCELVESESLEPAHERVQVIVTDRDSAAVDGTALLVIGKPLRKLAGNRVAASLPAQVDQQSLKTVCQLLADNVALRKQIASSHQQVEALSHEAQTDPLTQLPNRRAWEHAIAACRRQGSTHVTVALFDLDQFKPINDQASHPVGDLVLSMAARGMQRCVRESDLLARVGGDEFGLLLSGVTLVQAGIVIERVRLSIPWYFAEKRAEIPPACANLLTPPHWLTASAGYAAGPADNVDELITRAEEALQRAKRAGGNQALPDDPGGISQPISNK